MIELFSRLWSFGRTLRRGFFLVVFLSLFTALIEILSLFYLFKFVDRYIGGGGDVFFDAMNVGPITIDLQNPIWLLMLLVLATVFKISVNYTVSKLAKTSSIHTSSVAIDSILNSEFTEIRKMDSGTLVDFVITKISALVYNIILPLSAVILSVLVMTAYATYVVWVMGPLILFGFVFFGVIVSGVNLLVKNKLDRNSRSNSMNSEMVSLRLAEVMRNHLVLYMYDARDRYRSLVMNNVIGFRVSQTSSFFLSTLPKVILELLVLSSIVLVLSSRNSWLALTELSMLLYVALRVLPELNKFATALNTIRANRMQVNHLLDFMKTLADKRRTPFYGGKDFEKITLKNIHFNYDSHDEPILKDFSMSIKRGDRIVISGPSGSGKSTLMEILLGILQPVQGEVILNLQGNNVNPKELISNCAYVSQNALLFSGTLGYNLSILVPNYSKSKLLRLCEDFDFFPGLNLEELLAINIGENGTALSGGQRQRFTILMALLTEKKIVFFDEAFSALDRVTAEGIMKVLSSLDEFYTLVFITHDLSLFEGDYQLIKL